MAAKTSVVLTISNHVHATDKRVPTTGVWSPDNIGGWDWDKRMLPYSRVPASKYGTYVGGHEVGLLDGTYLQQWQSGVVDGIKFFDFINRDLGDELTLTPRYKTGTFSVYWDSRFLYSDYSVSQNVLLVHGTRVELAADAVSDSVSARIFKRLENADIITIASAVPVSQFTGELSGSSRVDVGAGGSVETRKYEMIVSDNVVEFNQQVTKVVGNDDTSKESVESSWESKGAGFAGRTLFLDYFPVDPTSVKLVSIDSAGNVTEWSRKETLNFSTSAHEHFAINADLGAVFTGGAQARPLVVATAVSEFATEITVQPSIDISSYPDQGIVKIADEQILYTAKLSDGFAGCIRGYNSTTIGNHPKGSLLEDVTHGKATTARWYISYTAVPRIDYEVTDHEVRTANFSTWLDVRALAHVKSNNVVQIVSQNPNLARVELSTDEPLVGGNLYGPVFYGTDTGKLIATAFDSVDQPVEDIELTIQKRSGPGFLNGSRTSYSAITNSLGQISCYYSAPYNENSLELDVVKTEHVGSETHMTVNLTTSVTPEDIWVFQILKHDPVTGTVGVPAIAFGGGPATEPNGLGFVDVWIPYVEDYNGGSMYLEDTGGVRRLLAIRWAEARVDGAGEPYVRFFTETGVTSSWLTSSTKVWLLQPEAVAWTEGLKNGSKVILYEWSTGAQHPVKGTAGAWAPVRPDRIQGSTLVFENRNLPIPDPVDPDVNLGGYLVIAPSEARFYAWGRDPFTGNLVVSNDLRFKVLLPNTLVGVDSSGVLPVPYGWTFVTEEFNIGAGIGGANFITINPAATGINQFAIRGII